MINHTKTMALIALVSSVLLGCTEPKQAASTSETTEKADATAGVQPPADLDPAGRAAWLIEAADAAYTESEAAGHAWVNARRALETAREAAAQGDFAAAGTEGERALRLAEASLAQARAEEDAWRDRFPQPRTQ